MSFPRTPVDGQTTVTNDIVYTYNSNNRAWKKQFGTIAVGTATVTILDDSSSPITGALTVPGGVSIKGNLYAGGKIYTQGWEISTSTYIQFNTATTLFNTATQSIKLIGGSQGSIPYQNSSNSTGFISIGPAGNVLQSNGTTAQWVTTSTGLGFGVSTTTDVAFKLATTATNLVGVSYQWGTNTIGGIPMQFPGTVAGAQTSPYRPGIPIAGLFTDFSSWQGAAPLTGGCVEIDLTNPSVPSFTMSNIPPNTPHLGAIGPTGVTGPPGPSGPSGKAYTLLYPWGYTYSQLGWRGISNTSGKYANVAGQGAGPGPAYFWYRWQTNGASNASLSDPYYVFRAEGANLWRNIYQGGPGGYALPMTITFGSSFNQPPTVVLTQLNPQPTSQNNTNYPFPYLTWYPVMLYVSAVSAQSFTISGIRTDTGAAITTMSPLPNSTMIDEKAIFWQAYGY